MCGHNFPVVFNSWRPQSPPVPPPAVRSQPKWTQCRNNKHIKTLARGLHHRCSCWCQAPPPALPCPALLHLLLFSLAGPDDADVADNDDGNVHTLYAHLWVLIWNQGWAPIRAGAVPGTEDRGTTGTRTPVSVNVSVSIWFWCHSIQLHCNGTDNGRSGATRYCYDGPDLLSAYQSKLFYRCDCLLYSAFAVYICRQSNKYDKKHIRVYP